MQLSATKDRSQQVLLKCRGGHGATQWLGFGTVRTLSERKATDETDDGENNFLCHLIFAEK
jgi:hypothetical protein